MERKRGENLIKAADGLPWSTCEQGFVSRGEIPYGILTISVVNFENLSKYFLGKKLGGFL